MAGKIFGKRPNGGASTYEDYIPAPAPAPQVWGQAPVRPTQNPVPAPAPYSSTQSYARSSGPSDDHVDVNYAEPVIALRYASAMVDFIILVLLTLFVMLGFDNADGGLASGTSPRVGTDSGLTLTLIVLWIGYGILFEASRLQATPGKLLFGLIVTDRDGAPLSLGRAIGRNFGKALTQAIPFYIGYLLVHWTDGKRTLHDLMVGSLVFHRRDRGSLRRVFD